MYAVLIYGFPFTLLGFEWGLRTILKVDASGFTGPTLAAAGLSFLMPLVKPKKTSMSSFGNYIYISRAESNFMPVLWIAFIAFLFCWTWSCYMSIVFPHDKTWGIDNHLLIGGVMYSISLIFTFIKEKV